MLGIDKSMDSCISSLAHKFLKWPDNFFTESDAHSFLYYYIFRSGPKDLKLFYPTKDNGRKTVLVHREYPTSFRFFKDKEPLMKDSNGGRGHYDLVILNPDFVGEHTIDQVMARDYKECCKDEKDHLIAALEFKYITKPLTDNMKTEIRKDFEKLSLALEEGQTQNAYIIIFNRCREENSFLEDLGTLVKKHYRIKVIYVESTLGERNHKLCAYSDNWSEMLKFSFVRLITPKKKSDKIS